MPPSAVQAPRRGPAESRWLAERPTLSHFRFPGAGPFASPATLGWSPLVYPGHAGITRIARVRPARRPRALGTHPQGHALVGASGDGGHRPRALRPLFHLDSISLRRHQPEWSVSVAVLLADDLEDRARQPRALGARVTVAVPGHLLLLPQGVLPLVLLGPTCVRGR